MNRRVVVVDLKTGKEMKFAFKPGDLVTFDPEKSSWEFCRQIYQSRQIYQNKLPLIKETIFKVIPDEEVAHLITIRSLDNSMQFDLNFAEAESLHLYKCPKAKEL